MIDTSRAPRLPPDVTQKAFEEYGLELHRFLTRRMRCSHTARDLAQDAYLRFLQVSRHETIRNSQAFLYRLASNLVYEFRVREKRSPVVFDSELLESVDQRTPAETGFDPADRVAATQELERTLQSLPKIYRTVLLLRKREGLSPEEIAQRLGFTKKTVYDYLTRALAHIKAQRCDR